jgi:hypothetical protein
MRMPKEIVCSECLQLCSECLQHGVNRERGHPGVCGPNFDKVEVVQHPPHYGGDTLHETIKCLAAWGLESDALLWNAVKYIARHGKKGNALEDLRKAKWYLDRRIKQMEEG